MLKKFGAGLLVGLLALALAACVSADPTLVARAVNATLTAAITPSPVVIVVTAVNAGAIPSVTPAPTDTPTRPATATPTLAPPTPLPSATAEPGGSPAPSATRTPAATLATPAGKVILADEFDKASIWDLGQPDAEHSKEITGGQLVMTLKAEDKFTILYTTRRAASNSLAVTQTLLTTCNYRDRYGLLFRVQDGQNYYQFDVDCDGRYRLGVVVAGTYTPLRNWTDNPAIARGRQAANTLAVRTRGETVEVYANQQLLWQTTDATFSTGGFGLYAGSGYAVPFAVAFENLRVWEVNP